MKLVRIVSLVAAFIFLLLVGAVIAIYFNQHRLVIAVLTSIKRQTGVEIISPAGSLKIRDHLVVVLDHPVVMSENREIVSMDELDAIVNYRSIIYGRGLPLRALILHSPVLTAPFDTSAMPAKSLPRPDRTFIMETISSLGDLALVSRRIVINDLKLRDSAGLPLFANAQVVAFHRRRTPDLWHLSVDADCVFSQLAGTHIAGSFSVGSGGTLPATTVMQGTLFYWKLPLQHLSIGNLDLTGKSHGQVKFSLAQNATIDGFASIGFKDLTLSGVDLAAPIELGDYAIQARFSTSQEQLSISKATVVHDGKAVAAAQLNVEQPYENDPHIVIGLAGLRITWNDILRRVRKLRRVPAELQALVRHMSSGQMQIEKASFESSLGTLEKINPETILKNLSLTGTLTEVSFVPPAETQLPDVTDASVQILFEKQTLSALQGTAKIGKSEIHDIELKMDFAHGLDQVPYQLSMIADLDLHELRPVMVKMLDRFEVPQRDRLQGIQGIAHVDADTSGVLRKQTPARAENYTIKAEPRDIIVNFRGVPGPIGLPSGLVTLRPGSMALQNLSARATGGYADFNGELKIGDAGVRTRGLKIDIHQIPVERWLPGIIDPEDVSAQGNVGGEIVISGDQASGFLANGKLTLLNGQIHPGFLRAPIIVHPALLIMRDRTMSLSMPAAELEKSPIDFNVTVADLRTPTVRIDANVQKLDIEVMKFVQLPWMPPTHTHPPRIPISGHIDAREANLEKFAMKNAKTDFKFIHGDWTVDNLSAHSFEGHINLNIVGREKDDWIRMFGNIHNMNAASLFLLSSKFQRAPLSGRLDMTADVWANTNTDFFATLAGTALVKLHDGTLDKFTLLSRLLEFIDVRSWVTAQLPDPRVSGLPFRTVSADFKGRDGVFYTDDLVLDGPAIDIIANGNMNLDQSTLDMKIGLIPFSSVTWALSAIPIVGKNVGGGTKGIISAYFNVRGPIADPSVTPAPITSVAEILKKTFGLPVNIIRPDTIK